jgi:hypothetical protein
MKVDSILLNVAFTISFIANVYVIYYLYQLEKAGCECSGNWRRQAIMVIIIIHLLLWILSFVGLHTKRGLLSVVAAVTSVINVVLILQFISILESEACKCSEGMGLTIMKVVAIFDAVVFILAGVITIVCVAGGMCFMSKDNVLYQLADPFSVGGPQLVEDTIKETVDNAKSVTRNLSKKTRKLFQ